MRLEPALALAFEFEKAPDDLKKAALTHKAAYERLQKATAQRALWQNELVTAEKAFSETQIVFQKQLERWDVISGKEGILEEAVAEVTVEPVKA